MKTIKLNEIFYSLQGEGSLVGTAATFLRLAGCPLRCKWCDTKYAWDENAGKDYTFDQIKEFIMAQPPHGHIVITGGEPMVSPELPELTEFLAQSGVHITIETAGIKHVPSLKCDLMSISPKLSNSLPDDENLRKQHENCLRIEEISKLMKSYDYQLKFVVDNESDLAEIAKIVTQLEPNPDKVLLMPQATTASEYLGKAKFVAEACKKCGFRFSPRLHILFWHGVKGK